MSDIELVEMQLTHFMQTEEWISIIKCLGAKHTLHVLAYDSLDTHDAIYLTGAGFVDNKLRPVNDLKRVVEGFVTGYFYGTLEIQGHYHHPTLLIPWIQASVAQIKQNDRKKRRGTMNWPKRIVLVRHGESEGNIKSPHDISFDNKANHEFALTDKGKQQARITGEYLQAKYGEFDSYFCSTFRRTQETLSLLYPEVKPNIDSRLNEWWRGIWHTMSPEKILTLYPEEPSIRKREGEYHYRPPGGQSCQDVELMIHSFIHSLRADYADKNVLISAHGKWMLLFWRIILNHHPSELELRLKEGNGYKNCTLVIYESDDKILNLVGEKVVT